MKIILAFIFFIGFSHSTLAQESYRLSAESKLTISGTSTVHDWTVTANTMDGTLEASGNIPKAMNFKVAVADIKSERGATMDKKMHVALKQETNPKVVFSLKEASETMVSGSLSIAGSSQDVELPCEISISGNNLKIKGAYGFGLQEFYIEPPTAMFGQVVVGPNVTVKFDLVFVKE